MIVFVIYAVVVWFLVLRHRRRLAGFFIALAGTLLAVLLVLGMRHYDASIAELPGSAGRSTRPLQILVWGESGIVLGVGLFIACLPRPPRGRHCRYCWYDMRGLDEDEQICPECGTPHDGYARRPGPP